MSVTLNEVERIAALARLSFTDEEKVRLTRQLNEILDYMAKLNTVDTTGVEPLSAVIPLENVFREDVARASSPREEMLRNAPDRTGESFRVPNVMGDR
jgi:aspartyl-tRNA(Asn)/glutamyl-tRNA(Gln) amidotransferase subunit C